MASGFFSLNLFLQATPFSGSESIDLLLAGSTSGATYGFGTIPLYLEGEPVTSELNLYVRGSVVPGGSGVGLPLFVQGHGTYVSNYLDLSLWGTSDENPAGFYINNDLDLYIEGEGLLANSVPSGTGMNLVIQTPPGIEDSIELFLEGSPPNDTSLDLYSHGILGVTSSGLPLYTYSIGESQNKLKLFARGFTNFK